MFAFFRSRFGSRLLICSLVCSVVACTGGEKRRKAAERQNLKLTQADLRSLPLFVDGPAAGFSIASYDGGKNLLTHHVAAEAEHGAILQVEKRGEGLANVFIRADEGAIDLSSYSRGTLEFDIKVKSLGEGGIRVKLDSGYPAVSDITIPHPGVGVWQKIRIPMQALSGAQNSLEPGNRADIASIVHPIVLEPVASGDFSFEIDNVVINADASESTDIVDGTDGGEGSEGGEGGGGSEVLPVGNLSLTATDPQYAKVGRNYLLPTELWGSITGPKQTNRWWSNLVLASPEEIPYKGWGRRSNEATPAEDKGREPIFPLPYGVKSIKQGIYVSHKIKPRFADDAANPYVMNDFLRNFSLEASEIMERRTLLHGDELSASMKWSNASGSMTIPFVMGSPYLTAEFQNTTPVFATQHAIMNAEELAKGPSKKIKIKTNHDNMTWIIYASEAIELKLGKRTVQVGNTAEEQNVLTAAAPLTGVVRIALLPRDEAESLLDAHMGIYPVSAAITTAVRGDKGDIVFKYETKSFAANSGLLMLTLPHHRDILTSPMASGESLYRSIKGQMVPAIGDTWTMQETLPTIGFVNRSIPADKKDAIREALLKDKEDFQYKMHYGARTHRSIVEDNPYYFGKYASGMGQLALIADELGEDAVAKEIREQMKKDMLPWLTGTNPNPLVYDTAWGGLVSKKSLEGISSHGDYVVDGNLDFGNGVYNDHHFHYGYFLHAAAIIGKKDPEFVAANRERLFEMVRDFANPLKNDPHYPYARVKDWYHGHSWAGGITPLGDGKNQESTSESVHAYYGFYLLASVLGDQELTNFGRLLLATEIRSAQKYWQLTSASPLYEDAAGYMDRKVTGILFESKAVHAIWWDGGAIGVHMIQYMPYTAISEQLLPASYIREAYPVASAGLSQGKALDPAHAAYGYVGYIYMAHAILDKEAAWNEVNLIGRYDDGNTRANTLYWMATRP